MTKNKENRVKKPIVKEFVNKTRIYLKDAIQILQTGQGQAQSFSERRDFKTGLSKEYDNLPTANHMSFIIRNWDDLDCLNEKFDELREKEINNAISEFEKSLLKDVLKKRILEFPNPYLPFDYEEGQKAIRKYKVLEREFNRKYGDKSKLRKRLKISSWLK